MTETNLDSVVDFSDECLLGTVQDISKGQTDLYKLFLKEAIKVSRLTEAEEKELGYKVRDNKDVKAKKKLVTHNLRLVLKFAHAHRRPWTNIMDLIQEASAGMTIAAERWNPDVGTRFGTYAVHWMRAQVTHFLMLNCRIIHTGHTRSGRRLYFQLPKIKRKLSAAGQETSVGNIAREAQIDEHEVALILSRLDGRDPSFDAPLLDTESGCLGDILPSEDSDPELILSEQEENGTLMGLAAETRESLATDRERAIWDEHLVAIEPISFTELGAKYGVSKQRISQIAERIKKDFKDRVTKNKKERV